jgi:hypothetical protein
MRNALIFCQIIKASGAVFSGKPNLSSSAPQVTAYRRQMPHCQYGTSKAAKRNAVGQIAPLPA